MAEVASTDLDTTAPVAAMASIPPPPETVPRSAEISTSLTAVNEASTESGTIPQAALAAQPDRMPTPVSDEPMGETQPG